MSIDMMQFVQDQSLHILYLVKASPLGHNFPGSLSILDLHQLELAKGSIQIRGYKTSTTIFLDCISNCYIFVDTCEGISVLSSTNG